MKIIEDFKPFNDLYYINCYYNAFFPILQKYDINIVEVILEFLSEYEVKNGYINMKVNEPVDYISYYAKKGLGIKTGYYCASIIDDIIDYVQKKNPVIIWGDGYYQPIILDLYQKQHWLHAILIIGYEDNEFQIIEHSHKESLNYGLHKVHKSVLQNIIDGNHEYFQNRTSYPAYNSFIKIKEDRVVQNESYNNQLELYMTHNYESLVICKEVLIDLKPDETLGQEEMVTNMLDNLNDIINIKKSLAYACQQICPQKESFNKEINRYIEKAVDYRNVIGKNHYMRRYDKIYNSYYKESILGIIDAEIRLIKLFHNS